jgi:hypothetical protein
LNQNTISFSSLERVVEFSEEIEMPWSAEDLALSDLSDLSDH